MYTALYMSATRTQIYLTPELRARIDDVMVREHKSLAQIVREALERYLDSSGPNAEAALASTFGTMPGLAVPPRDEWERG